MERVEPVEDGLTGSVDGWGERDVGVGLEADVAHEDVILREGADVFKFLDGALQHLFCGGDGSAVGVKYLCLKRGAAGRCVVRGFEVGRVDAGGRHVFIVYVEPEVLGDICPAEAEGDLVAAGPRELSRGGLYLCGAIIDDAHHLRQGQAGDKPLIPHL